MVPLDVTDGSGVVPLLPICMDITCVQSYCARPTVPPASNRKPPVMRMVVVMLDETPSTMGPNTCSPVIMRYGSPLIVTVCDRQSLNSMRDDVVSVPEGPVGVVTLKVIVIDPPPGHSCIITLDKPPGAALTSMPVAWVSVAPTIPWVVAGLTPVGGVTVEGAEGELPPHPVARPRTAKLRTMRGAMTGRARI